jgi:hypothetical protein
LDKSGTLLTSATSTSVGGLPLVASRTVLRAQPKRNLMVGTLRLLVLVDRLA